MMQDVLQKPLDTLVVEDMDKMFLHLNHLPIQLSTKTSYWTCMKIITRALNPSLSMGKYRFYGKRRHKLPEEILTEGEVAAMISVSKGLRNRTLISLLYESGARLGELQNLRIKSLNFDEYGCRMLVDGKTGQRFVRIVKSTPLLMMYLKMEHRFADDPNSLLFYRLDKQRADLAMHHSSIGRVLKIAAQAAGITKRIHPHLMRHSRATHLAKHLSDQEMKVFFGWSAASSMAGIYVHLSGKDIDDKILGLSGIFKQDEIESIRRDIDGTV